MVICSLLSPARNYPPNCNFYAQSKDFCSCLPYNQLSESFLYNSLSKDIVVQEFSSSMATQRSCENAAEQLLVTDWNALISVEEMMRPSFNNSSFPEIECSFDLSAGDHVNSTLCTPDFLLSNKHCIEKNIKGRKRKAMLGTAGLQLGASSMKSSEAKEQNDVSPKSIKSSKGRDEKKEKGELNPGLGARKSASNQAKKISQDYDSPKEEYIHVRAKRGQATNSHSLAERVRREKISERMKVLQDLVPGCDKITGKAVMLDEIINYVQSLQRQVEFLSMKLATVHPELKIDIEQIFSKDIHQLDGNPAVLALGPGLSTEYPHFHGAGQVQSETLMNSTMHQLSSMSQMQNVWDEELQNAIEMVFIPQHPVYNSGLSTKNQRFS